MVRKENGNERGDAGIIRKVDRSDNRPMYPLDGV
jgi:hypothetical protein